MRLSLHSLALTSLALSVLTVSGCATPAEPPSTESATEPVPEAQDPEPVRLEWALAIHGGAGVIDRDEGGRDDYLLALSSALRAGKQALEEGKAALEVVELVVTLLEDDPKFNAGRGAVFTNRGTHELDAAIMDGRTLAAGAVAGVKQVRNPIQLARQVMERSRHVLLAGSGADDYAREVGMRRVQQGYFTTDRRIQQLADAKRAEQSDSDNSTVGAVALDRYGNLAAATSTGGMTNKRFGRVGDVPLIGAGTYANNATAAVSCTGRGEEFIRHAIAHDLSARIEHGGRSLQEAASEVIHDVLAEGDGGLIAVDAAGNLALEFNSPGMFRGAADSTGRLEVGIWEETVPATPAASGPTSSGGAR